MGSCWQQTGPEGEALHCTGEHSHSIHMCLLQRSRVVWRLCNVLVFHNAQDSGCVGRHFVAIPTIATCWPYFLYCTAPTTRHYYIVNAVWRATYLKVQHTHVLPNSRVLLYEYTSVLLYCQTLVCIVLQLICLVHSLQHNQSAQSISPTRVSQQRLASACLICHLV